MGSRLLLVLVGLTLMGAIVASAATLGVDGGVLQVFAGGVDLAPEPAIIKITPQTINLASGNNQSSVNVLVRFPSGLPVDCKPDGNDSARMMVKGQGSPSISSVAHPNDANSWMLKFTRNDVLTILSGQEAGDVTLLVRGVINGCPFVGEDTIK